MTTTTRKQTMLELFTDGSTGDKYHSGRLITRETDAGTVALIGYGWQMLAEFDPDESEGAVYFGHKEGSGRTISRYLNEALEAMSDDGIDVEISDESPVVDTPPECVKYIDNYVGDFENLSDVEKSAIEAVRRSLDFL